MGGRVSEVRRLAWSNVPFEAGLIQVRGNRLYGDFLVKAGAVPGRGEAEESSRKARVRAATLYSV